MTSQDFKRTVYILGAGFSVPAGAPVMDNFFDAMQACYFSKHVDSADKTALDFALSFRREMAAASDNFVLDLENLEQLFGLLEIEITAGKKTSEHRRQFIHAVLRTLEMGSKTSSYRDFIGRNDYLTNRALGILAKDFEFLLSNDGAWLYHVFAALVAKSHLKNPKNGDSVITFNYDPFLDRAFHEARVPVEYAHGINSFIDDYPSFAWISPNKVPLYKLHGSANWIQCIKSGMKYLAPPIPGKKDADYSLFRDSISRCPHCRQPGTREYNAKLEEHTPIIVPPTWNKAVWQAELQSVWKAAIADLATAGRIVVIGFSLPETDLFFRYLMAAGVPIGKGVDVYLFDPNDKVEENFRKFLAPIFRDRRFYRITRREYPYDLPLSEKWNGHFDNIGISVIAKIAHGI